MRPSITLRRLNQGTSATTGVGDGVQAEGGDITAGQHAVQRAVLVGDGDGGDLLVAHQLPRTIHGDGGIQTGRPVKVQVAHLGTDVLDQPGRLEAKAFQHAVGLVADGAHMHRHILLLPQRVFQCRVGQGGHNGVGIRVAVSRSHRSRSYLSSSFAEKCFLACYYRTGRRRWSMVLIYRKNHVIIKFK